jgi:choline dehydrogenase
MDVGRRDGFDIVVVGAGAAGCVVARRLSESGDRTVLLLEAGPDLRGATPIDLRDGWRLPTVPDWGLLGARWKPTNPTVPLARLRFEHKSVRPLVSEVCAVVRTSRGRRG